MRGTRLMPAGSAAVTVSDTPRKDGLMGGDGMMFFATGGVWWLYRPFCPILMMVTLMVTLNSCCCCCYCVVGHGERLSSAFVVPQRRRAVLGDRTIMRVMHQATKDDDDDDDSNRHQHHEDTTTHEKKTTMMVPIGGLGGIVFDNRPKPHLTSSHNATLPLALTVLDPESYPSRSKALRTIRYVATTPDDDYRH